MPLPAAAPRQNFGLLELCTACATLVIVLGLGVSLARRVRSNDSQAAFAEQLSVLNGALARYGVPLGLSLFGEDPVLDEARDPSAVHAAALRNTESWTGTLHVEPSAGFDPWGMPVVLLDGPNPRLGMAPHLRGFFMSAGPDGRYFTIADNIYGYEIATENNRPATQSTSMPSGHGE